MQNRQFTLVTKNSSTSTWTTARAILLTGAFIMVTIMATAASRPISDFLSVQGTYCLGTDSGGNPVCGGSGGCFHYIPPFPNYLDWTDPSTGNSVTIDYAGLFNAYMGNRFGTTTSGSINEVVQKDGTVIDTIVLHTQQAVTWASVGFSGTGPVLFGANEPQVAAGATPSLGSSTLRLVIAGPSAGAPLPDLIELLNGCGSWSFISLGFIGTAQGSLPDGSAGMVQVTQTGLLRTAGIANSQSRVALDGFPAEHITISAISQ